MTLEKCMKSPAPEKKKECEFRESRQRGTEKVYVCTGSGFCPFREDVSEMIKRVPTDEKQSGGKRK